jgi:hypothetical protein
MLWFCLLFAAVILQRANPKVQGAQKVSEHLMITTQKVTSNIQNVPRQFPGIY